MGLCNQNRQKSFHCQHVVSITENLIGAFISASHLFYSGGFAYDFHLPYAQCFTTNLPFLIDNLSDDLTDLHITFQVAINTHKV